MQTYNSLTRSQQLYVSEKYAPRSNAERERGAQRLTRMIEARRKARHLVRHQRMNTSIDYLNWQLSEFSTLAAMVSGDPLLAQLAEQNRAHRPNHRASMALLGLEAVAQFGLN